MSRSVLLVLLLATGVALADDAAGPKPAKTQEDEKKQEDQKKKDDPNLGMSILGNQEAPKALVLVPWKRSELGNALGVSTKLDDSRQPIDKDVFLRMLSYYEVRSETTRHEGAAAGGRNTAVAK